MRVETLFFLDKKKSGLSSMEYLGLAMTEAGNEFGPDTAYGIEISMFNICLTNVAYCINIFLNNNLCFLGSALIKVGNIQQTLGLNQREFIKSANDCFVNPMNKYLETDMKTVVKERSLLEKRRQINLIIFTLYCLLTNNCTICRLDLDACKTRVRKTRMLATTKVKVYYTAVLYLNFKLTKIIKANG